MLRINVMAENKTSSVEEVLKREKLIKDFEKEKQESEKKAIAQALEKISKESHAASNSNSNAHSARYITSFDMALSQSRQDMRYYFLNESEYGKRLKEIFQENEALLKKYGITGRKYLEYVRESFERFKKIHGLMPLEPMKPKHFKYVEDSIQELIRMFNQRFGK
jgi:parvulin-like peptidyl-prolyl isomerase